MTGADVPEDGELRIGSVRLPAGRRIRSDGGRGEPVAWATSAPVPDAGRVWAALSDVHAQSGLVPFLLSGIAGGTERPWDSQEFRGPEDMTGLDHLDAAELLREDWQRQTTEYDEEDEEYEDDDFARSIAENVAHRAPWSQPSTWPQSIGRSATNAAAPACTTSPASR